jgi:hypothetical protein
MESGRRSFGKKTLQMIRNPAMRTKYANDAAAAETRLFLMNTRGILSKVKYILPQGPYSLPPLS